MSSVSPPVTRRARHKAVPRGLSDRYVQLFFLTLLGYATASRGFAYVGIPPFYIGEILLALGVLLFIQSGTVIPVLVNMSTIMLGVLIALAGLRAAGQYETYGIDALRDSVIVTYGAFTFIVMALLLEKPGRINDAMAGFIFLAKVVVPASPFLYFLSKSGQGIVPAWPSNGVQIIDLRPGEMAVHLTGAAVLTLLGFRRATWPWLIFWVIGMVMVAAQSRGGTLAVIIPLIFVMLICGKLRELLRVAALASCVLLVAYVTDIQVKLPGGVQGAERAFSIRQLADNAISVFESSSSAELDGTKAFRLAWWSKIVGYTVNGEYFWTGKGFGMSLAVDDGFVVGRELGGPVLRSPHNGPMTVLARSGVPGIVLFAAVLGSWYWQLGNAMFQARRRGDADWANMFLFVMAYVSSILIDASFDVALEGPMLGIWFWALIGFGLASNMIYRTQQARLV